MEIAICVGALSLWVLVGGALWGWMFGHPVGSWQFEHSTWIPIWWPFVLVFLPLILIARLGAWIGRQI